MQLLIVLSGICILSNGVLGRTWSDMEDTIMDMCLEKVGASKVDFIKAVGGKNVPNLKCFWQCVMKADGSMSVDGTINVEKIINALPEDMLDNEKIVHAVKTCSEKLMIYDECNAATRFHLCIMANVHSYNY